MKIFKIIKKIAFGCLFPSRCGVCDKVIPILDDFCPECEMTLRKVPENLADHWATLGAVRFNPRVKLYLDGYSAPFYFLDGSSKLVKNYKIKKRSELADIISDEMYATFTRVYQDFKIDFICAVPMLDSERRTKGFDHTELLSEKLSQRIDIKYIPALKQIRPKLPQHNLTAALRSKNVRNIYAVAADVSVRGKTILLIDDISTTGASVNECARILKKAGAEKVYCLLACVSGK